MTPTQRIEAATMEIMAQAVKSALQLNNFPLNESDVACAFDEYFRGTGHDIRDSVRSNLQLLGYPF